MSSHREAPEISKDPVADNTDTLRVRQPGQAGHGHDHHQLRAARGPARRAELLRVRRRRPLLDLRRQRRRRRAGHRVPVQVQDEAPQPEHVPLQHRPDHRPRQPELEPAPVLRRQRVKYRRRDHNDTAEAQGRSAATWPARRATSARARRRTTSGARGAGGSRLGSAARRSSPASATRGSSSTWGRSSTSATCGRSRTST